MVVEIYKRRHSNLLREVRSYNACKFFEWLNISLGIMKNPRELSIRFIEYDYGILVGSV